MDLEDTDYMHPSEDFWYIIPIEFSEKVIIDWVPFLLKKESEIE